MRLRTSLAVVVSVADRNVESRARPPDARKVKMTSPLQPDGLISAPPGSVAEQRERVQRAAAERAALRESELEAQASPVKAPRERIEIWERLHALRLPPTPGHVLVQVIARQTRLTIGQVHQEQRRRAGAPDDSAAPAAGQQGTESAGDALESPQGAQQVVQ